MRISIFLMGAAMVMLSALGCPSLAAERSSQAAPERSGSSLCVEGAPNPVDPQLARLSNVELRPTRTAQCPYGFDELLHRITALIADKNAIDSVETIEKVFSIPAMTTSVDDPRMASYMMVLSGKGGWRLLVWVREGFYPLNAGPARFVPGLRPKRLGKVEDAQLSVNLSVLGNSPTPGSVQCVPTPMLYGALTGAGWVNNSWRLPPGPDGSGQSPYFQYGDKVVSWLALERDCLQHIFLSQGPKKH
jgi:hypothetical protein